MSLTAPNTRAARPATKLLARSALTERTLARGTVVLCALAGLVYLVSLARSPMFIDEVFSWNAARGDWRSMGISLHYAEVTPPLYYLLLHAWIAVTGESEIAMRLPSVLAALALIAATGWLGRVVAGARVALIAAALTALSPLVLTYAQQVRAYVFVMLAVTIAAAAVVEWTRAPARRRWPVIAAVAAGSAILLHYTAVLALVPLVLWTVTRPELDRRRRVLFACGCALPGLALLPLLLLQMGMGNHDGAEEYARITKNNLFAVVGSPFDSRAARGVELSRQLGALVVADALALLALAARFRAVRARGLLLGGALFPLGTVIVASVLMHPVALTRYTTVAVPFMIVAIAVAIALLPRALSIGLGAAAAIACAVGVGAALLSGGLQSDTRGAVATAAKDWQRGDALYSLGYMGFNGALDYYAKRDVAADPDRWTAGRAWVPGFPTMAEALAAPGVRGKLADGRRLWFVSDPVLPEAYLKTVLGQVGYEPREHVEFDGITRVQLVLAGPKE